MALKEIANENLQLTATSGNVTNNSTPDDKVKAGGSGVFFGQIDVSVDSANGGTVTNGDGVGSGSILSTALTCKNSSGDTVMRIGDKVTVNITGTQPNPTPPPTNIPGAGTVDVEITNAGQTKAKAQ